MNYKNIKKRASRTASFMLLVVSLIAPLTSMNVVIVSAEEIEVSENTAIDESASETNLNTVNVESSEIGSEKTTTTTTDEITPHIPNATSTEIESSETTLQNDTVTASSTVAITTGDTIALANILTIANTNLVNSTGTIIFSNLIEDQVSPIDFRTNNTASTSCALVYCEKNSGVEVAVVNDAYIHNILMIEAQSGDNSVEGTLTETSGAIVTGNAYAGLNLVNVANSNFIDSHYLLITLNAFEDVHGDIIFPSLSNLLSNQAMALSQTTVQTNVATVENSTNVTAETGANTSNSLVTEIITGQSIATTNVLNLINSTLSGGESISILLRVHGTWLGTIFGGDPRLNITDAGDGYYYITSNNVDTSGQNNSLVTGTSTALIHNDIKVLAGTGNNTLSDVESGLIETGNAFSGANIVNIANTNIIGRNWTLAIINIFGDFIGNLSFGQPDVWIGEKIAVPKVVQKGSEITYTFTVTNNGDAPSTRTRVSDAYAASNLSILESSNPYLLDADNKLVWEIGTLPAGATSLITYKAVVTSDIPATNITNVVTVTSYETDFNDSNNTDTGTVKTSVVGNTTQGSTAKRAQVSSLTAPDVLETRDFVPPMVTRLNAISRVAESTSVSTQTLVIKNQSEKSIPNIVLHDYVISQSGAQIADEVWSIGTLLPYEEITLSYDISFTPDAPNGHYTLSTALIMEDADISFYGNGSIDVLRNSLPLADEDSVVFLSTAMIESVTPNEDTITDDVFEPTFASAIGLTPNIAEAADTTQLASVAASKTNIPLSLIIIFGVIGFLVLISAYRELRD